MKPRTERDGSGLDAAGPRASSRAFLAGDLLEMLARGQGDESGTAASTAASAADWILDHADRSAAKDARRRP